MQTSEIAKLTNQLPEWVARMVAFTLVDAASLPPHDRGRRVLELAETAPQAGAELRRIAIHVGFDSQRPIRRHLSPPPRLRLVTG